jgi:hypothetical protein
LSLYSQLDGSIVLSIAIMSPGKSRKRPQQQDSAPEASSQQVSGEGEKVNQTTSQQNASSQRSRPQAPGQQKHRRQKAGQRNGQRPNTHQVGSSSQRNASTQNQRHQAARPQGSDWQTSSQNPKQNDHEPNASPEESSEQSITSWFHDHQNSAPKSPRQNEPVRRNRRPQNAGQANRHEPTHRLKTSSQPQISNKQSSDHQNPRLISNTHSEDNAQQKQSHGDTLQQTPRLTALQKLQNYTKEWIPDLHSHRQPFAKLHRDLVLCIMDHLHDPVDKVSLALTTRSMWDWTKGSLKLEDFDLPLVLPVRISEKRGMIKPWPYFKSFRWRLLERLEDGHWKCCSGCLRLHPKTEFFPSELKEPANERYCRAPGLIQACPHMLLTYKKCAALQKVLSERAGPNEDNKHSPQTAGLSKDLYHECKMNAGTSKVIIGTQPFITDKKQHLVFQQKYALQVDSKNMRENLEWIGSRIPLPNLCPHRSIITHCLDMLDEKSRWNKDMIAEDGVDNNANVTCRRCNTYFSGFRCYTHSSSQKFRIEFCTSIHVGKADGLQECKVGHGIAYDLKTWIDKTHLANVLGVADIVHFGCKCRKNCRKLEFDPITCASPVASLPDTTWKETVPAFPF